MTLKLTEEQSRTAQAHGEKPLRLIDDATNTEYVLLRADLFQRIRAFFEDDPLTEDERRVILQGVWKRADWDDPAMDDYAALDPRKQQ